MERVPTLRIRQFATLSVFLIGFMTGLGPLGNYDTWWHLAGGRWIVEHGQVAKTDPFSFTMRGQEWVMHEWGWDVILYLVYRFGGPLGALLLKAFVAGLVYTAMFYLAIRRGANTPVALVATLLCSQAMLIWMNERPQVMQPLFVLCALHLMHSYRQGKYRALLWYPVLMVVWVNIHGSFPFGLVLFALFMVCELMRVQTLGLRRALPVLVTRPSVYLAILLLLAILACFVNPQGARGALYPLDYVNGKLAWAVDNVQEWKSPNWHENYLRPLEALLLLTFAAMAISPLSPAPFDLLSVLMGLHMMLQWGRNGPLFATLATPVMAVHLSAWVDVVLAKRRQVEAELEAAVGPGQGLMRAATWVVLAFLVAMAGAKVPWRGGYSKLVNLKSYPTRAVEVIAANNLQGNMWNVYHWGGYLVWRFYLQRPVFIDGRADVYGKGVWDEYRKLSQGQDGWQEMLDKRKIEYILIETGYASCRTLDLCPEWTRIYSDSTASLYVRTHGVNARVVQRFKAGKLIVPKTDAPDPAAVYLRAAQASPADEGYPTNHQRPQSCEG